MVCGLAGDGGGRVYGFVRAGAGGAIVGAILSGYWGMWIGGTSVFSRL